MIFVRLGLGLTGLAAWLAWFKRGGSELKEHPEANKGNSFEPTIGEQLRFAEFSKNLDKADPSEVLEVAKLLGKQAMVTQPAVIRYLAREAANNLMGHGITKDWSAEVAEIRGALLGDLEELDQK